MATVTIIITDDLETGGVNFDAKIDPPIERDAKTVTGAQYMLAQIIAALKETNEVEREVIDGEEL